VRIKEGAEGPELAYVLGEWAFNQLAQEDHGRAEELFERALETLEKRGGLAHPLGTRIVAGYSELLRETGRAPEADALAARVRLASQEERRSEPE